jgi:hypothetical protein
MVPKNWPAGAWEGLEDSRRLWAGKTYNIKLKTQNWFWPLRFISATLLPFHETYTRHIPTTYNPTQCGDYHASET